MTAARTDRLVVVGAGIAGVSAAAGARAAGFTGEVVLLGSEDELPYRRPPVSKELVRGEKDADDIRIKKAQWYEDKDVRLRTGVAVSAVDPAARTVTLDDGSDLEYGSLVLATGGRARTTGTPSSRVLTLRDLADAHRLREHLVPGAHVIVVGAGLIGSEIASDARDVGVDVTVLEEAELPLPHLLPPSLGQWCAALHRARGTDLVTGVRVERIEETDEEGMVVTGADGRRWHGSVVVLAIGQEPRTELARDAGIDVATPQDGGGIVVDERGRTSVAGVWAAGDVARMPNDVLGSDHRVEHWQNAQNHGTAVGRDVAGQGAGFHEVPWCWSDQYGLTLQVTGWPQAHHDVVVRGDTSDADFTAFFLDEGRLRGAVCVGRPRDVRTARTWIADGARPDPAALADVETDLAGALSPIQEG